MAKVNTIENFRKAAEGYFKGERFSDFTIICEGKEFKVHRCFICAHSKYFERCCEGMFEEAQSRTVELKEDLLTAVERMITFFYTWDYDDTPNTDKTPKVTDREPKYDLQVNAWVYAIAEKYDVPDLKALALEKFNKAAANYVSTPKWAAIMATVHTVYKHIPLLDTDIQLQWTLVRLWIVTGDGFEASGLKPGTLASFLGEFPEFAEQVTGQLMNAYKGQIRQYCKSCNRYEDCERAALFTTGFKCGKCGCTETKAHWTLNSTISPPKFW